MSSATLGSPRWGWCRWGWSEFPFLLRFPVVFALCLCFCVLFFFFLGLLVSLFIFCFCFFFSFSSFFEVVFVFFVSRGFSVFCPFPGNCCRLSLSLRPRGKLQKTAVKGFSLRARLHQPCQKFSDNRSLFLLQSGPLSVCAVVCSAQPRFLDQLLRFSLKPLRTSNSLVLLCCGDPRS